MPANLDPAHVENIPAELRALPQWVLWQQVTRDGKATKEPRRVDAPGTKASSTDPASWATLEAAVAALPASSCDGIGFVFTEADPFAGVDIDKAMAGGSLHPDALALIEQLDSYTEWSPSGKGTHTIVRATCTAPHKITAAWAKHGIERYSSGRYFTMTGRKFPGTPDEVNDAQQAVDALAPPAEAPAPPPPATPSLLEDRDLLDRAYASRKGAEFRALYDKGDTTAHDGDASGADLALCNHLAFWTGRDPVAMDRLFRGSALMREHKWNRSAGGGETYGQRTIRKAIETCTGSVHLGVRGAAVAGGLAHGGAVSGPHPWRGGRRYHPVPAHPQPGEARRQDGVDGRHHPPGRAPAGCRVGLGGCDLPGHRGGGGAPHAAAR